MKDFQGKIAVITGAGTGMGRELARRLASESCNLAICDVIVENMTETKSACEELAPPGTLISAHECDVSEEAYETSFIDRVQAEGQLSGIDVSVGSDSQSQSGGKLKE